MPTKRFSYYQRLSTDARRIYRASDAISHVAIPDVGALRPLVAALEQSLTIGARPGVARAAKAFVDALLRQLGAPPVAVRVRDVRPELHDGELHGLYTFARGGKAPTIEVWMRTLAHERVVRFRTFLRTLLHEIVHHLDVTVLGLGESFHTEGFFRRESSLVRQLAPATKRKAPRKTTEPKKERPTKPVQLGLFDLVDAEPPRRRRRGDG